MTDRKDFKALNDELHLRATKTHGALVEQLDRRVDVVEERVELVEESVGLRDDRPTVRSMATTPKLPPRPAPRPPMLPAQTSKAITPTEAMRKTTESNHEFNTTFAAMAIYLEKRDRKLAEERLEERKLYAQAFGVVARELGAEDRLPDALQKSIPPPAPDAPKPPPTLARRIDRQRVAELIAAATAALWAIEHVARALYTFLGK